MATHEQTQQSQSETTGEQGRDVQSGQSGSSHKELKPGCDTCQPTEDDQVDDIRWQLEFGLGRSQRYTSKRKAFYEFLENLSVILSLVGGSAVVSQALINMPQIQLWGGILVVCASITSLVFRWSEKARLFDELYRRYNDLEVELIELGKSATEADLKSILGKYVLVERDEPAVLNVLMISCHNEECSFRGVHGAYHRLRWWQRLFAHTVSLPPYSWEQNQGQQGGRNEANPADG